MSQGDYIKFKKNAHILSNQNNLDNILSSQTLTNFKTFQFGKEIINSSPNYNYANEDDKTSYFGVVKNQSHCPDFLFCRSTHQRPYRVLKNNSTHGHYRKTNSLNDLFLYNKKRNLLCVAKEMQQCDEYLYLRRHRNKMSSDDTQDDPNYVKYFSGARI